MNKFYYPEQSEHLGKEVVFRLLADPEEVDRHGVIVRADVKPDIMIFQYKDFVTIRFALANECNYAILD